MPQPHVPTSDDAWAALLGPAADAASEGLLVFDVEGRVRAANRAAQRHTGPSLIGTNPLLNPDWQPCYPDGRPMPLEDQPTELALQTGRPQRDVTIRVDRRGDRPLYLNVNAVPLFAGGQEQPYGAVTSFIDVSPYVYATEALRERERELNLLESHSGDLIARHRSDGVIVYAAGRVKELVGVEPEMLIGLSVTDVCHPDDVPVLEEATRVADTGQATVVAYRVPHQAERGRMLWLESTVSPLRRADGRREAISTTRDITARKAVEERLRQAEQEARRQQALLQEAQEMARLGSWAMDAATGTFWGSGNLYRIFGLHEDAGEDELLRAHATSIHPEDLPAVGETLRRAAETGEPFELTYRMRRPDDGGERVMHGRGAAAERDADGQITHVWGTTQDVTDLHALEAGRRAAERRFRAAFEHAPIGMAVIGLHGDARGRWLSVNPALTELLGYDRETLLQSTVPAYFHPDDAPLALAGIARMADGDEERVNVERRLLNGDGQILWVLITVASVAGEDGRPAYGVMQIVDITERKRFEGQLQYLADHDALTGLFNRRRFEEELDRVLAEAERYDRQGAVLVLDLDGFKYVNDTLGHPVGDRLISRLSGTLRAELRETDVIARLGGDEFGIILPEVDVAQARAVADKLLAAVERDGIVAGETRHARVTASAGLATFAGADGISAEELLVEADIAMYDAKEAGRNQAALHERTHVGQGRHVSRLTWLERIRTALAQDRFVLYAQPIVALDVAAGPAPTFELLLRMQGEDGDLVPPATFLHVAERFDLVQDIDRWVVERAVDLLRAEHAADSDLRLSVNISGRTIGDAEFAGWLEALLRERPVPAGQLILEITETAAIVNLERAQTLADTLTRLGCLLALDDFGAGFASFAYLKHLPFDVLKIDGEFVRGLHDNPTDRLVVEAVVAIARGMGKPSLAEFVADEETLATVRDLGVDFVQGFHVGRPLPLADALATARR